MEKLFNVTNGWVHVDNQIDLRGGISSQELILAGLVFIHEFDMKTGWIFRTTKPQALAGHVVQLALGFQGEGLKRVSFGFSKNPGQDMDSLFKEHNIFLQQELGAPFNQNDHQNLYQYAWGEIVSEFDPRGSGSFIQVSWM